MPMRGEGLGSLLNAGLDDRRGHIPLRIAIDVLAAVSALVVIRVLFLSISVRPTLWVGKFIYGVTDPLILPISFLPGASHELFGLVTVADLTLLAIVVLIPVAAIAWGRHRSP